MSTAVVKHAGSLPAQSMAELATAGDLLAQAGFLGTRNPGEGFLVMAACQQTGMSLVEFQQKYHLRQGRFSMQAHAMLAEFVERGGSYKLIERSPERAALELTIGGNTYLSEITWEQAQEEPFVYAGGESAQLAALDLPREKRQIKSKYKTPRSRMQMLWARAVSDGVVVVDPGARGGIYTPEEMDDIPAPARSDEPARITVEEATRRMNDGQLQTIPVIPFPNLDDSQVEPEAAGTEVDPSRCPVVGQMHGVAWADMPIDVLELALEITDPAMTDAHRAAVETAMQQKEQ